MRRPRCLALTLLALLAAFALVIASGCRRRRVASPASLPALRFVDDDVPAALAEARRTHRLVLVDAWATWCHSCFEMRNLVFTDASLRPLAARVVFAALDTDREDAGDFLARYRVEVWPTLFLLDPDTGRAVGYLATNVGPGELRRWIGDTLALHSLAQHADDGGPARALLDAVHADATGARDAARDGYARALAAADARVQRVAVPALARLLARAGQHAECVRVAREHAGASADMPWMLLMCANELPAGAERAAARRLAADLIAPMLARPPADVPPDSLASLARDLATARRADGDAQGARVILEQALARVERAAAQAREPAVAATFDYTRLKLLEDLGRADEAVALFAARAAQLPREREPLARLAYVYARLHRDAEAHAAVARALPLAYGPPRLRLLRLRSELEGRLGRAAAQRDTACEELRGWAALPAAQRSASAERDARARCELGAADAGAPASDASRRD